MSYLKIKTSIVYLIFPDMFEIFVFKIVRCFIYIVILSYRTLLYLLSKLQKRNFYW